MSTHLKSYIRFNPSRVGTLHFYYFEHFFLITNYFHAVYNLEGKLQTSVAFSVRFKRITNPVTHCYISEPIKGPEKITIYGIRKLGVDILWVHILQGRSITLPYKNHSH